LGAVKIMDKFHLNHSFDEALKYSKGSKCWGNVRTNEVSPNWSLSFMSPTWKLCSHSSSSIRATVPAYLIILDFITLTLFREEYTLRNS
jgi:hypothetical protein